MKKSVDEVGQKIHLDKNGRPACNQGGLYIIYTTKNKEEVSCNRCKDMNSFKGSKK